LFFRSDCMLWVDIFPFPYVLLRTDSLLWVFMMTDDFTIAFFKDYTSETGERPILYEIIGTCSPN
jgi:hypothetical protein